MQDLQRSVKVYGLKQTLSLHLALEFLISSLLMTWQSPHSHSLFFRTESFTAGFLEKYLQNFSNYIEALLNVVQGKV